MTAVQQAKDLMDLIATPAALVTGTFLSFAGKAIKDNQSKVRRGPMRFGLLAAVGALGVASSLAAMLAPLAFRSVFIYTGPVETVLVVYWMIFLSTVGTACYAAWTIERCRQELKRPAT